MTEKEYLIVAMRGRDPFNPNDRSIGNKNLEQRLEINSWGGCNCLTTVSKDNMILEIIKDYKVLKMVRTEEGKMLRKAYESHEIHHGFNEYREPSIKDDGVLNTLTTVLKDNYILEIKGYLGKEHRQSQTVYSENGLAHTINTAAGSGNGYVLIKQATRNGYISCQIGGVCDLSYPNSKTRRGRVQGNGQICPTITSSEVGIYKIEKNDNN